MNCKIIHQLFSLSPYIYVSRRNIPNFGLQILVYICSLSRLCQVNSIVSRPNRHLGICVANKTSNFGCNVINFQQGVEHIRTFTSVKLRKNLKTPMQINFSDHVSSYYYRRESDRNKSQYKQLIQKAFFKNSKLKIILHLKQEQKISTYF